jgi:hypothetical protein
MKVEHDELRIGDTIELADEPATVLDVVPWPGGWPNPYGTGCSRVAIERPAVGTSNPGARGTYYLGSPVRLLERPVLV